MRRRRALSLLGTALLAGCTGGDPSPAGSSGGGGEASTPTASPEPTASPTPPPTPTPYPEAETTTFEGTGQTATEYFTPTLPGPTVIATGNQGSGNFAVWILDESGQQVELVANEIGSYTSVDMFALIPGSRYSLDVAGGDWGIEVRSLPLYERGGSPAGSYGREYASFVGPVEFAGGERVTLSASSGGNVAAWLKDATGANAGLLFNEIGPVQGLSTRISAQGTGYIDVRTNGTWSMEIE